MNGSKFLVDVNLPKHFRFFDAPAFIHVRDVNPRMADVEIWEWASRDNLVILTKDADFYHRYLSSSISPCVVFFQLGNQTLQQLHLYFELNWERIVQATSSSRFILAKPEGIYPL